MFRSALKLNLGQLRSAASHTRQASTLVYADFDSKGVLAASLKAVQAAAKVGGDISVLLAGAPDEVVSAASKIAGVSRVINAKGDQFNGQLAEPVSETIAKAQEKYKFTHIFAPATTSGKNVLPRVAAKLNVNMLSEIINVVSEDTFDRTMYAGNNVVTLKSKDAVKIATVRGTAFAPAAATGGSGKIEEFSGAAKSTTSEFVKQELQKSDRPSLTSASVVVCGGRGLKSAENFSIMNSLADKLNAAVGATRAAVDAGYAPNTQQIGQTGQTVSPALYIGAGVSGAIQHLAGMKDSKTIVVINKDPDAPFFQVADYGLVADLFQAVPEITKKL